MPHIPLVSNGIYKDAIRVLVTGFGPFATFSENPSWLAVQKLHNVLLDVESAAEPVKLDAREVFADAAAESVPRPIHITALNVPVVYSTVRTTVAGLHARPPTLPPPPDGPSALPLGPQPPAAGYDLVLHVGVGRSGRMRVERRAHKRGYGLPDARGRLAPEAARTADGGGGRGGEGGVCAAEHGRGDVLRGFGEGYEPFDEELGTDVDVDRLVEELRSSGVEHVEPSGDAGRYLCDFIYYCSLAEAQRMRARGRRTKVLFVHCPPTDDPLGTDYVADALRRIVVLVCGQPE